MYCTVAPYAVLKVLTIGLGVLLPTCFSNTGLVLLPSLVVYAGGLGGGWVIIIPMDAIMPRGTIRVVEVGRFIPIEVMK